MDLLVSLIHSNSITQLMPKPFQIDSDIQIHIQKTKIPISSKTSIKLTISNHHNFHIKQCKILLTARHSRDRAVLRPAGGQSVHGAAARSEPRTHKIVIEEFCQMGRLEIKFGRLEIIWYNLESGQRDELDG